MKYHIDFDLDFKRNPYEGLYISLEGTEGSGKSTQVKELADYFQRKGKEVILTREPRKEGLIGNIVQQILLGELEMNPIAFQYLFAADRQLNHIDIVEPSLKLGKVVISDRSFWSAVVYGIVDKELDYDKQKVRQLLVAQSILSFYHQFILPDFTFYLKIPVKVSLQRIAYKTNEREVYESEEKVKKTVKGYNFIFNQFKEEITFIDGKKAVEDVTQDMIQAIEGSGKL